LRNNLRQWRTNKNKLKKTLEKIKLIFNSYIKTNNSIDNKNQKNYFSKWIYFSEIIFKHYKNLALLIRTKILAAYYIPIMKNAFIAKAKNIIISKILSKNFR
jgi:hypothetical protein